MTPIKPTPKQSSLVALATAAVVTVYAAGYARTKPAADRFATETDARRNAHPVGTPAVPAKAPVTPGVTAKVPPLPPLVRETRKPEPESKPIEPNTSSAGPDGARFVTAKPDTAAPPVVAAAPPAAPPAPDSAPAPLLKDGTYKGWGTSRHGDIEAAVTIEGGRIVDARITQCLTRYSCSWIAALPPQVVKRQSPEVDYVSGATQSTNAFYYAILEALGHAR